MDKRQGTHFALLRMDYHLVDDSEKLEQHNFPNNDNFNKLREKFMFRLPEFRCNFLWSVE